MFRPSFSGYAHTTKLLPGCRNAAVTGDEVIVAQGEYFENINLLGKAITVRSTDPNDAEVVLNTIINGGGSGSVVTCPIPVCPADITGDGNVGINDFLDLLAVWGPCP